MSGVVGGIEGAYILVEPSFEVLTPEEEIKSWPRRIESAGRTCYRSEDGIGYDSADRFCAMLIRRGHNSVLEHCQASVKITCDRATSHQLVRHRLCSFSQESQRFVDYKEVLEVIRPPSITQSGVASAIWAYAMESAAKTYHALRSGNQIKPEDARSVLPNAVATRIVVSANVRQWRWVFHERAVNTHAQHQIRFIMAGILRYFHSLVPVLFDDLMNELKESVGDAESFLAGYRHSLVGERERDNS